MRPIIKIHREATSAAAMLAAHKRRHGNTLFLAAVTDSINVIIDKATEMAKEKK